MHGQARELRQDRKVATVATFSQCRGVPGHFFSHGAVITGRIRAAVGATLQSVEFSVAPDAFRPALRRSVEQLPSHRPEVAAADV